MRSVPQSGHHAWTDYQQLPGHVWCFSGLDACTLGYAPWETGATLPSGWAPVVNDNATLCEALPADAVPFMDAAALRESAQLCVVLRLLPLPPYHGLPMGQIFSMELGMDGFVEALEAMAPGLAEDLGYVSHPWFRCWLDVVKASPTSLQMDWVARSNVSDSITLTEAAATRAKPFSLALFSLNYSLAYRLHRDCLLALISKMILLRFLKYKDVAR
jgi:hypothetical protein